METIRTINQKYRKNALALLLENCPCWMGIVVNMDNFVALIFTELDSRESDDLKESYRLITILSFIRTHYVILDLIESSDVIEAATLIRKQVELLARFKELESKDLKSLNKKTPNIANTNIKSTYGSLSEIAHSSRFETLSLLGVIEGDSYLGFSPYPIFNKENVLKTISIYLDVFFKFVAALLESNLFNTDNFNDKTIEIMDKIINIGVESNIDYFKYWTD